MILSKQLALSSARYLPLALSLLSAGEAAEITEEHELLDINAMITGGRDGFVAFVVTGDSMVDDIRPGHIVFVDTFCEVNNGDIVVSNVNGVNNVKIFERRTNRLYLVPKNASYEPKEITKADDFHVLGVVKGYIQMF